MLDKEVIERIMEANDIVEVIGEYIPLQKVGKNYRALCPFHVEKTPSFYVSPEKQLYHCFGCKAGGNVITFVMNFERIGFTDAVRKLAERTGIRLEKKRIKGPEEKFYKALEFAREFYMRYLWSSEGKPARDYLFLRGFSKEILEYFSIGFVPIDAGPILEEGAKKGISVDVLIEAGVIHQSEHSCYPWLRDRIVFPIMNSAGRTIGFGGRTIKDEEPKYINSPETPVFKKRRVLYGFDKAKNGIRRDGAMLVEGYFDVMRLHSVGIENAVAPLGTAFTEEQAGILRRYNERIYLLFDGDESGMKAAKRSLEVTFLSGLIPTVIILPPNEDPDSFLRERSKEEFINYISEKMLDPVDFILKTEPVSSVEEKREVVKKIKELLRIVKDDVLKELYLSKFSEKFGIRKEVLVKGVEEGMSTTDKKEERHVPTKEEIFLRILISHPEYIDTAKNILPVEYIKDEEIKNAFQRLYEGGEKFGLTLLMDLVSEDKREKFAEWAFESLKVDREEFKKELKNFVFERKKEAIISKIEEAEMQGNEELVERMVEELNRLVRYEKKE